MSENKFICFYDELTIKDVPRVGGKNASLGEMYGHLAKKGIKIPNGFATTAQAYNYFLESTIKNINYKNLDNLKSEYIFDLFTSNYFSNEHLFCDKKSDKYYILLLI